MLNFSYFQELLHEKKPTKQTNKQKTKQKKPNKQTKFGIRENFNLRKILKLAIRKHLHSQNNHIIFLNLICEK